MLGAKDSKGPRCKSLGSVHPSSARYMYSQGKLQPCLAVLLPLQTFFANGDKLSPTITKQPLAPTTGTSNFCSGRPDELSKIHDKSIAVFGSRASQPSYQSLTAVSHGFGSRHEFRNRSARRRGSVILARALPHVARGNILL